MVTDANFDCSPTGFSLQAMDSSHVSLVALLLRADGFDHYRCDRPISMGMNLQNMVRAGRRGGAALRAEGGGTGGSGPPVGGGRRPDGRAGPAGRVARAAGLTPRPAGPLSQSKMLKCAGNDDIITMKADDNGDTVTFMFESKGARPGPRGAAPGA